MESEHFLPFFVVMVISVSSPSKTFPHAFAVIFAWKENSISRFVELSAKLNLATSIAAKINQKIIAGTNVSAFGYILGPVNALLDAWVVFVILGAREGAFNR